MPATEISGFYYIETKAMSVTDCTSTLIDFFVTNCDVSSTIANLIRIHITDHLPIFLLINKPRAVVKNSHKKTFEVRNVTDVAMGVFRDALLNVSFLRTFKELYKESFPYRNVKLCKKLHKPWMTKEVLQKVH